MKKALAIALCTLMAGAALVGCGDSKFIGTWKSVALEEGGEKYTADDEDMGEMVKNYMTLDIEKGGEGSAKVFGESDEDLKWEADGDTITLTIDGDDADAELKDDQLVLDLTGGVKIYLEKDD